MSMRKRKKNPRGLVVTRRGGWGGVLYIRKRAYEAGKWHCPMKPADSERTAACTAGLSVEAWRWGAASVNENQITY